MSSSVDGDSSPFIEVGIYPTSKLNFSMRLERLT